LAACEKVLGVRHPDTLISVYYLVPFLVSKSIRVIINTLSESLFLITDRL
jgi:hypothetical protein